MIAYKKLNDKDAISIAEGLKSKKLLIKLVLRINLIILFPSFQKLKKIIIDDNNIGVDGAKAIAESLKELKSLTLLDLSINLIIFISFVSEIN